MHENKKIELYLIKIRMYCLFAEKTKNRKPTHLLHALKIKSSGRVFLFVGIMSLMTFSYHQNENNLRQGACFLLFDNYDIICLCRPKKYINTIF
jgi:hypothetical protein